MKKDTTFTTTTDEEPIIIQKRPPGRPPGRKDSQPRKKNENFGQEYVLPGDNSKYLGHALTIARQPLIDLNDINQVRERIDWYFEFCLANDIKPTVAGLCNALKVARQNILMWKTGKQRDGSYQAEILRAYDIMEELWEHYMLNGKINPVSGIFLGKNLWQGYSDRQDLVVTPTASTTIEPVDQKLIEAKYAELPPVDDEE